MNCDGSPIVVACSADRLYVRPLAVTLISLAAHLTGERRLVVHILSGRIPDTEKDLLSRSLDTESVTLIWHEPDRSRLLGVPLWGRMPVLTYDKLLVPDVLPQDVDQALWLDCDTLVLGDVTTVWDRGTGGCAVVAAQDSLVPLVSSRMGVARYREIGLEPDAKYFNAGVMLVNLELWRARQVSQRALEYVKRYAKDVSFWDQEGLNAVLAGAWAELDEVWNRSVSLGRTRHAASEPPAKIVHFNGNLKPWKYDGENSYYRTYYEYVDRTAWAGWRPAPTWRTGAIRSYERSALRRVLFPTERYATGLWKTLTTRVATLEDVSGL